MKKKKEEEAASPTGKFDLSALLKNLGESKVRRGTDDLLSTPEFNISTSCITLDIATGGGLPTGKMVEIYGPEASGKSTLVMQIAAQCQKAGGMVYLIDHESSLNKDRAETLGMEMDKLVVIEEPHVEGAFEAIYRILDAQEAQMEELGIHFPTLIIWDTLTAAPTKKETEGVEFGEGRGMMEKPRVVNEAFRRLQFRLAKCAACLLIISQVRVSGIGTYRPGIEPPGGWALKHYPSLRLKVTRGASFDSDEDGIDDGQECRIEVVKSRMRRPGSKLEIPLYYATGLDDTNTIFNVLKAAGLVDQAGPWMTVKIPFQPDVVAEATKIGGVSAVDAGNGASYLKLRGFKPYPELVASVPVVMQAFITTLKSPEVEKYV